MSVNEISVIFYYICLFLSFIISFGNTEFRNNFRCTVGAAYFCVFEYICGSDVIRIIPSNVVLVFLFGFLEKELMRIIVIKLILKSKWIDAVIQSCVLSVFFRGAVLLHTVLINGVNPQWGQQSVSLILSMLISTAVMMIWYRKIASGITGLSSNDKKYLSVIAFLLVVFEYRVSSAYINTLDNTLGILSLMVPILITTILKKKILEEHYVIEQGKLRAIDHLAENEMNVLNRYESVLTKSRHELLNHLNKIRTFADQGDKEKLNEYIDKIIEDTDKDFIKEYSDNIYVNTIIRYLKTSYPDLVIETDARVGNDCLAEPLDLGIVVLCLSDSSFAKLPKGAEVFLAVKQVEKMIIISEFSAGINLKDTLTETDFSMMEEVMKKYQGSIHFGINKPGDITVLLSCE